MGFSHWQGNVFGQDETGMGPGEGASAYSKLVCVAWAHPFHLGCSLPLSCTKRFATRMRDQAQLELIRRSEEHGSNCVPALMHAASWRRGVPRVLAALWLPGSGLALVLALALAGGGAPGQAGAASCMRERAQGLGARRGALEVHACWGYKWREAGPPALVFHPWRGLAGEGRHCLPRRVPCSWPPRLRCRCWCWWCCCGPVDSGPPCAGRERVRELLAGLWLVAVWAARGRPAWGAQPLAWCSVATHQ